MKTFVVTSKVSKRCYGEFDAEDEAACLDKVAQSQGFRDWNHVESSMMMHGGVARHLEVKETFMSAACGMIAAIFDDEDEGFAYFRL